MENDKQKKATKLTISNGNNLYLSGVEKVISSTPTCLQVVFGSQTLEILGTDISASKIDVESGVLEATGNFSGIKFQGAKQKQNIFKKIFGWCFTKHYYKAKYCFALCFLG